MANKTSSPFLPEALKLALRRLLASVHGIILVTTAILVLMMLISYNQRDPSWNTAPLHHDVVNNWLGAPGSIIADALRQFFGITSFVIPVIFASWGWRRLQGHRVNILPWRGLLALAALLAGSLAIHAIVPSSMASLGGAFGALIGSLMPFQTLGRGYQIVVSLLAAVSCLLSLFLACALSWQEWRAFFERIGRVVLAIIAYVDIYTRKIVLGLISRWHIEKDDALWDDDETDDKSEAEIKDNAKSEPVKTSLLRSDSSSPIRKRPTARRDKTPPQSAKTVKWQSTGNEIIAAPLPPLDLLQLPQTMRMIGNETSEETLTKNAQLLESVLSDFGVNGNVTRASAGPVVTLYELEPSPGTRASRVISLADDIARNMRAASVRVAVVTGRNVIGIELPNKRRATVYLRELLSSQAYKGHTGALPLVLGKDISGAPIIADLARMPHLLIAGTTGSGKSVAINTMILSLVYHLPPWRCRFIMIDPKMLELSVYEGIPHLLAPVVTDPRKAIMALKWTVREMEERYRSMSKLGVRNIEGYNARLRSAAKNDEVLMRTVQTGFEKDTGHPILEEQPLDLTELPYIVVIVDEMADLMIVAGKEIEGAVQRLAQMARAAGIHIMMATQRPSVDVITGTIKANFPTRISFQVTSRIDSRTILGEQGAEQLLGQGDMLYMAGGGRITRVHGPFVSDEEVEAVVKHLKTLGEPDYKSDVTDMPDDEDSGTFGRSGNGAANGSGGEGNELYDKAVAIVLSERKASISFIQRQLQIGYNRAANLVERMEKEGIVGSANHVGKREILGRKMED